MASGLMIDGNLAKFLQGHNVFGSRDLNRLLELSFLKIMEIQKDHLDGWSSPDITLAKIRKGDYKVKMLDINQLFDVGNDFSVEAWLHAAHMRAHSRHGRAKRDKGTVYLGKESKRWAMKFYNKFREMLAKGSSHQLPDYLKNLGLEGFIEGKLRAEMRIFSKELQKHGITHGYHLTPELLNQLFNTYLGKIDMTTQVTVHDEQLLKMPRTLQGTFQLWRQGADVRNLLAKPTFYRHRTMLLEYGVDIASMHIAPEHNNVIPMMRIIEAFPVANPVWAYERGLIAA
jgi:II/X family phage/plasmid replication protein